MEPNLFVVIGGIIFSLGFLSVISSIVIMKVEEKKLSQTLDKEYGE